MAMLEQIEKEKQMIARCEKSLSLEKLKKRKAETRHKIELGGLVIKSGITQFNRFTILGALNYIFNLMTHDASLVGKLETKGQNLLTKD
ncbi:MAG: conjugal transfer protein TraD [Legionella sp.]|uniref:conjugal transfer protein TraD n=1 Tax=Legionella sp. TaxID=459 RepID=UPI00284019C7|nr:conjugal transfer protein TraD [Legionella sp.]